MAWLKYNNARNDFDIIEDREQHDLHIDDFLKSKLDNILKLQKKNWDAVFIICGTEGSGKSTLSFICGQYLTGMKITLDNIANGSDDAMEKLQRLPDGSTLIVDEAELLFSSRDTMTREQKQLTKIMMIIRQKKMVLILVSPVFFDLSKYIAVDRSRFLLRAYTDNALNRGRYAYWGTKRKMRLYHEGKKNHGMYLKPKANIYGIFTEYKLPFDDEYQKVKLQTLLKAFEKKDKPKKTKEIEDKDIEITD